MKAEWLAEPDTYVQLGEYRFGIYNSASDMFMVTSNVPICEKDVTGKVVDINHTRIMFASASYGDFEKYIRRHERKPWLRQSSPRPILARV